MASPKKGTCKKDAWKIKTLRSTFGPQCLATQPTAPSSGFGSAVRDAATKAYISPAMDRARAKSQGGNNSPGPIYAQPSSVGPQALSTAHTAPVAGFPGAKRSDMSSKTGTPGPGAYQVKSVNGASAGSSQDSTKSGIPAVRFGHAPRDAQQLLFISKEHDKSSGGRDSPGPSAYNTGSTVGVPSKLSTCASVPAPKIGSNPRFRNAEDAKAASTPGPGQYSYGPESIESHYSASSHVGFPKAIRDANKKIFISVEHEKASYGELSPGPGTANRVHAVGKQLMSKARTAPNWSFGTGKRLPLGAAEGPGPGEYYA